MIGVMTNCPNPISNEQKPVERIGMASNLDISLKEARSLLEGLRAEDRLAWALEEFGTSFVVTTSFGIQSAVLLNMLKSIRGDSRIPVLWVDTGYLPAETYCYAEELTKLLKLDLRVLQSPISPARMEALHGKLWETGSVEDLEKYHLIRKVKPLETALNELNVGCWASGVRGNQTDHRRSMTWIDHIRGRISLRPLLNWTQKDVFYYMEENALPQHPLFEKGYSTVGDWHSSAPEGAETQGRQTRFGGLKQECGIHLPGMMGEGI